MKIISAAMGLLMLMMLGGCALITTPVKVLGTAASTAIEVTGDVVSAPFEGDK